MRFSQTCPKCSGTQIMRSAGKKMDQHGNKIRFNAFKKIPLDHFTCINCGYTEEWVTDDKELEFLRKKYDKGKKNDGYSDFV